MSAVDFALAVREYHDMAESVVEKITSAEVKDHTWFDIACGAPGPKARTP